MEKVTIRGQTYRAVWIKAIIKVGEGWRIIKPIKKHLLGYYTVKLEKK